MSILLNISILKIIIEAIYSSYNDILLVIYINLILLYLNT